MPAHYIRSWRLYRGLKTQAELAEKVGLTSQSISRLESGRMGYRQDILEKIAEALNCTPADLLGRDPATMPYAVAPSSRPTGMAETPREFMPPRVKVDVHPAFGALKGMVTIAPGYDIAQSPFTAEDLAEMDANLDRTFDMIEAGMKEQQ
jgi:transcriptional regulator with XRE-family HTH domain